MTSEIGSTNDTRGAEIADCTSIPKSNMFITICGMVWAIVWPPGVPTASQGQAPSSTTSGARAQRDLHGSKKRSRSEAGASAAET
jgi:hypothetical protein